MSKKTLVIAVGIAVMLAFGGIASAGLIGSTAPDTPSITAPVVGTVDAAALADEVTATDDPDDADEVEAPDNDQGEDADEVEAADDDQGDDADEIEAQDDDQDNDADEVETSQSPSPDDSGDAAEAPDNGSDD